MTITIRLTTTNAAFADDKDAEIQRIIRHYLRRAAEGEGFEDRPLMDANGNRVGSVAVTGK